MKLYVILVAILVSLIVGAAGGYYFEKSGIPAKLQSQQTTDKKECEAAQQITKDENGKLQKNRDDVAAQLDALKLQHPATCVHVTRRSDVPNGGPQHAAADGASPSVSSDWLRDFAAQCETYRSEVNVCVDFLGQERKLTQPDTQPAD